MPGKYWFVCLCVCLSSFLVGSLVFAASDQSLTNNGTISLTYESVQTSLLELLRQLKDANEKLQTALEDSKNNLQQLQNTVNELNNEICSLKEQLDRSRQDFNELSRQLDSSRLELTELKQLLQQSEDSLRTLQMQFQEYQQKAESEILRLTRQRNLSILMAAIEALLLLVK